VNFNPKVAGNQGRRRQNDQPKSTVKTSKIFQPDADNSVVELQSKTGE
jgi:hypothetical protein